MKRTRKELVEFLLQADRTYCVGTGWFTNMADQLIQEGWVEVQREPREFWIIKQKNSNEAFVYVTWPGTISADQEIIHVREVEDSND